jgi:hypothetical protein
MSDADLLQRLKTDLAPRTAELEKDSEAQKAPMQDVINKLSDAIRKMDQPLIKRHAKTLEGQVATYATLLARAKKLVDDLGKIDTADKDALKQIETLTGRASATHDKILHNYTNLKGLLDMAHKKAEDRAVTAVMEEWAEMESWMTAQREVARIRVKQMETLVQLARSSMEDDDAKSFAQAQEKAKLRLTWKPTQADIGSKYMNFCNACEKALGKDLQAELKRDFVKFAHMVTEIAELNAKLDAYLALLQKMKMPPPRLDLHKAATLLHVDEGKLKKAWDTHPGAPDKALEALVKDAKLKTTAKDMAATLRKAKLLP